MNSQDAVTAVPRLFVAAGCLTETLVLDSRIYIRDFEQVTYKEDLTPENRADIEQLGLSLLQGDYIGPDLETLKAFVKKHGLTKVEILNFKGVLDNYPIASTEYLPEDQIAKYVAIYSCRYAIFRSMVDRVSATWCSGDCSRLDVNRQIAFLNILFFWQKNNDVMGICPATNALLTPYYNPRIILKALQFYSKGTTSLKGGLVIPRFNRAQRRFFFQRLVNASMLEARWCWGASGHIHYGTPLQYFFIKDQRVWRRVFRYLNAKDYLSSPGECRGTYFLYQAFRNPGYLKTFLETREFDVAKFLYRAFDGFNSYAALDPPGNSRLARVAYYQGWPILRGLPCILRDLEALGVSRRHAFNCLLKILGKSTVPAAEIARGFEKHKFRAEVGRRVVDDLFLPAASALTPEELDKFQSFVEQRITEEGSLISSNLDALIRLKILTVESVHQLIAKYEYPSNDRSED